MGIVLMNIAGFALPSGAYFNPFAAGTPSRADLTVWAASFILVDGKMRALFSILFGASTLIVVSRAAAQGEDPVRIHLARMATLALFGVAHWVLLWPGDILLHYALIGVLALPFTQMETRTRLRVAALLLVAQAAIQGVFIAGDIALRTAAHAPHAAAQTVANWQAFAAGVGIGRRPDILAEIATMHGGWPGIAAANLEALAGGTPFLLVFDGPETLAYMLIGMAALSSGFLAGDWPRRHYALAAAATLGIALPLSALLALAAAASGFDTIATFAAATLGGISLRPAIAIGYAALLIPWASRDGTLQHRVRAAGRLAFSNYLATSLALTALFDGWGLGLFARLGRAQAMAIVPLVWLAMLAWSAPWAARFRYGPLEWAWRSLARGKVQPMRKAIATA
jgi:uncharacterized protein